MSATGSWRLRMGLVVAVAFSAGAMMSDLMQTAWTGVSSSGTMGTEKTIKTKIEPMKEKTITAKNTVIVRKNETTVKLVRERENAVTAKNKAITASNTVIVRKNETRAKLVKGREKAFTSNNDTVVVMKNETTAESAGKETEGEWKCCVDPKSVNSVASSTRPTGSRTRYWCESNPSNLSWYWQEATNILPEVRVVRHSLWKNKTIHFVGGSTTRQMYQQVRFEVAKVAREEGWTYSYNNRFVFNLTEGGTGCCKYDASHLLDLRVLSDDITLALQRGVDFVIVNVGTWWDSGTIGTIIDPDGIPWTMVYSKRKEWTIAGQKLFTKEELSNSTDAIMSLPASALSNVSQPNVSFASLMERAFQMMINVKAPHTKIIWRSETKSDCPVGRSFRASVAEPLQRLGIPVLNISKASCEYDRINVDGSRNISVHFCFPSPVLRYWLIKFQDQFLGE